MHALLDGIPLDEMNTSMTINATAAWLLALYMTVAEENGVDPHALQGTTQNDIIKEFLSRGTYAFPPEPSMRLIADMIAFTVDEVPKWNPINICSYHLQEAGATPVQEIAYALSTAMAVLDRVRELRAGGDLPARVRPALLLRQRRHPLRGGARQAPRDGPALGGARPRALRRGRPEAAALPLRRAGQLAGADRVPAREQHHPDRARGAGGDDGPRRARPRAPAAGVERGARPAAALGSAVVAADPADPGLRDRPARLPRHLRGLEGDGRPGGRADRGRARRDGRGGRARRRGRGRAVHEDAARGVAPRARTQDRGRRAQGDRPERLHRGRAFTAPGGRGRRHHARGQGRGALGDRRPRRAGASSATPPRSERALEELRAAAADESATSCPPRWPRRAPG